MHLLLGGDEGLSDLASTPATRKSCTHLLGGEGDVPGQELQALQQLVSLSLHLLLSGDGGVPGQHLLLGEDRGSLARSCKHSISL